MKNANCKLQIANWGRCRRGFTLVELLIVMLIIAILVLLAWGALAGVAEQAKEKRTRSIVMKLDQLIMQRYDGYRTRPLPIRVPIGSNPRAAATYRLNCVRELMRCELPERISDLCDNAEFLDLTSGDNQLNAINPASGPTLAALPSFPALARTYRRKAAVTVNAGQPWSAANENAECLYLIVSTMHDGDKNALDFFMPGEIGDVDIDGMREILDGWGNPISFLRWAPGFRNDPGLDVQWGTATTDDDGNGTIDDYSELGATGSDDVVRLTMQRPDLPDPFDPIRLGGGFALRPLIFSGGADKDSDIVVDFSPVPLRHVISSPPNNPYVTIGGFQMGMAVDSDSDGEEWADNITNHYSPTNDP